MSPHTTNDARERLQGGGRLLITRLRHIGDVVLTLPLVHALRQAFPAAELHYMAEPGPASVLQEHPDVDQVWVTVPGTRNDVQLVRQLRRQDFAAAIDLFSNPRSALLVRASGARVRIGEARRVRRHLYTVQRRLQPGRSALHQHLGACECLGLDAVEASAPRIHLTANETGAGEHALRACVPDGDAVVVHLAASQPAKEWPEARAVEALQRLRARGLAVALSTPPGRHALTRALAARAGHGVAVLPPMTVRELFGVLAAAHAVISVDGGMLHASVALGRPTVGLLGPTDPQIWFPYSGFGPYRCLHAGLDCGGCDREHCRSRDCMQALEPAAVESALLEVLDVARSALGTPRS